MKTITDEEYKYILETFQRLNLINVSGIQNIEHIFFCSQNLRAIINRIENKIDANEDNAKEVKT